MGLKVKDIYVTEQFSTLYWVRITQGLNWRCEGHDHVVLNLHRRSYILFSLRKNSIYVRTTLWHAYGKNFAIYRTCLNNFTLC